MLKPATWVAPVVGLDRDAIREVPIPCRDAVFPICPFEVWGIGILAGNQATPQALLIDKRGMDGRIAR